MLNFNAYPVAYTEDILEVVTLDLATGYWQIPLYEEVQEKSALTSPFGLFEFVINVDGHCMETCTELR